MKCFGLVELLDISQALQQGLAEYLSCALQLIRDVLLACPLCALELMRDW